ncbi:hypothetical protein LOZ66_005103 [Ophidiomyces ophidiicola]|nr:hypothetical protein LOZ66_005103 [Ophidiomyces ophidiicola]
MDLDSLLGLEEGFYAEGYELGVTDGQRAGYNEGSIFGIEKGFDKFQEMGRLYGKAIIWAKRLPGEHGLLHSSRTVNGASQDPGGSSKSAACNVHLPDLPSNPRLEKHLTSFLSLVDPLTLPMENTEDAVAEFDERLKKAAVKAKIIEKILGESNSELERGKSGISNPSNGFSNIEDVGTMPLRMVQGP